MHLSHELLAECVHCLRRDFKDRLGQERRVLPRFPVWTPITVRPGPDPAAPAFAPFAAWVRDLSRGGVGIIHSKPVKAGTQFVVDLPLMEGAPQPVLCQAVFCAGGVPDVYSIGARFVRYVGGQTG
jgi:hypothetical protein